jgi:hypothetical protein
MSRTDIFRKGDHDKLTTVITDWAQWVAGQSAESGSYSLLYAATAPELAGEGPWVRAAGAAALLEGRVGDGCISVE